MSAQPAPKHSRRVAAAEGQGDAAPESPTSSPSTTARRHDLPAPPTDGAAAAGVEVEAAPPSGMEGVEAVEPTGHKYGKPYWEGAAAVAEAERRIAVVQATRAEELDLSDCDFEEMPASVADLVWLKGLRVGGDGWRRNKLGSLPGWLGNLTSLTSLHVGLNQLTSLPAGLSNLTNLTTLDIYDNQLTSLPEGLGNLTRLTHLDVSFNKLTSLPESLGNLANLTTLDINTNKLTSLPESLGNLTTLTTLDIYENELTSLPEGLGNLTSLSHLDVSYNELTSLPESLGNLTTLTTLDINTNKLTSLPAGLSNLTNLTTLDIYDNQLTSLPEGLGNLTSLSHLDVSYNELTSLPESLGNLTTLTTLDINTNKLTSLPAGLSNLTNLTTLDIYDNQLTSLPEGLGNLTRLTHLDVSFNKLTSLPESLGNLANLTTLDIYNNQLTSLPESLGNLANLTTLDIYNNQLTSLPEGLGNLTTLTTLNINTNKLTSLPEWLGNLTTLTTLNIYNNQLTSLPESLGNLTSLTTLDIYNNQLTSLPEWLGNLTSLTTLDIYNNQLTSLPESLGNLTTLTTLNIYNNQFTSLPESLGNLTTLTTLDIYNNQLTSLPEWLGNLTSLTTLDVRVNKLTSLPESLGNLTSLTSLDVRVNKLTSLPEWLGNLTSLTTLDASNTQLTSLPAGLGSLTSLTSLNVSWNPAMTRLPDCVFQLPSLQELFTPHDMIWPPRSILEAAKYEAAAVLRPFWEALQRDAQPLSRARVVFCGDGGVGKTTLKIALQMESPDTHHTNEAVVLEWARTLHTTSQGWPHSALRHWIVHDLGCKKPPDGVSDMTGRGWLALTADKVERLFGDFPEVASQMQAARLVLRFARGAIIYDAMVRQLVGAEEGQPPPPPYAALLAVPHVWTEAVELSEWRVAEDRTVSLLDFPGQVQFFPSSEMFLWSLGAVYLAVYDARKTTEANIAHLSEWLGLLCSGMPDVVEEPCRPTVILVATHSDITVDEPTAAPVLLAELSSQPCFASRVTFHPEVFCTLYHEPDGGGLHRLRALLADLTSKSTDLRLPYATQRSILSLLHDPARHDVNQAWPIVAADDPAIDYDGQEQRIVLGVLEDIGVIKQLDGGARILIKPFDWLNRMTSALLRGVDPAVRLYGATPASVLLVSAKTVLRLINERGQIIGKEHAAEVLPVLSQLGVCFRAWGTEDGWVVPALLPELPEVLGDLQPILQLGAVFIGRRYTLHPGSRLLRFPPSFISAILDNMQRAVCGGGHCPLKGKSLLLRQRCIVLDLHPVRLRVTLSDTALDVVATSNDDASAVGVEQLEPAQHLASLAVAVASMQRKVQLLQHHLVATTAPRADAVQLPFEDCSFLLQPAKVHVPPGLQDWSKVLKPLWRDEDLLKADLPPALPQLAHALNRLLQARFSTSYAALFKHKSTPFKLLSATPLVGVVAEPTRVASDPAHQHAAKLAALKHEIHVLSASVCSIVATAAGQEVHHDFMAHRSAGPGFSLVSSLDRAGLLTAANMPAFLLWLEVAGLSSNAAPVVVAARALQALAPPPQLVGLL